MKYANFFDTTRININIGDYLQFMAVHNVYRHMGVAEEDIYYIDFRDVMEYNGEELILPINFSVHDFIRNGKIAISPKITPVFIALMLDTVDASMETGAFLSDAYNRDYFLKHAPIGCRDIFTYNLLQKYGIPAYVNGCMTATLPRYSGKPGEKIIFADAPHALLPYVPEALLDQECVVATQQYHFTEDEVKDYRRIFQFVASRYEFYKQNAKLVITSRLHVSLPCTAFGIPVILAKDYMDARFDFISNYIPVYDRTRYQDIDWQPAVPNIEAMKRRLIDLAASRIRAAMHCAQSSWKATTVFLNAQDMKIQYAVPHVAFHKNGGRFLAWAEKHWDAAQTEPIPYALWGASANSADYWKELIEKNYPAAKLTAVFDRYKKGELFGLPLESPDNLADLPDVAVIVCAAGATSEARALFRRLGLEESRYCIVSDCFMTERDLLRKERTNG